MGIDQTTAIDVFYRQIIKEHRLPFQPAAVEPTLDEQIIAAVMKRNPKRVALPVDENGNVIIDKEKNPDIYEWDGAQRPIDYAIFLTYYVSYKRNDGDSTLQANVTVSRG